MRLLIFGALLFSSLVSAQYTVTINGPTSANHKEAYLYTLSGAKDIIQQKAAAQGNVWKFRVKEPYVGMMKFYIPSSNTAFRFVSENKDVDITFDLLQDKVAKISYNDPANRLMDEIQDVEKKKEIVLPALVQLTDFYKKDSPFGIALQKEINSLQNSNLTYKAADYPFINYFVTNSKKYLGGDNKTEMTNADIATFLASTNQMLETSSLMRPLLIQYLNNSPKSDLNGSIDQLLAKVNVESSRGQVILAELLDLFDAYGMEAQKEKYLSMAENLKCKIFDRLQTTLQANKNTAIGSKFANYTFQNTVHSSAKSIYDVAADKKVIVFWSSTCSHCESDLPVLMNRYQELKGKKVEIIGLSVDTDEKSYRDKASLYPWINSSELRGWNSSFVETYSVFATPTYYVLDANNVIVAKPNRAQDVLNYLQLK